MIIMSSTRFIVFVIASSMLSCLLKAESIEELKQQYMALMKECMKEYTLTPEDITLLQKKQMPDKEPVKCLFACALKKANMMDESGMFSIEGTKSVIEKYFADDPVKKVKGFMFAEACKSVNEETVSDGDKGCERAAFIYKCSVEKAAELHFN